METKAYDGTLIRNDRFVMLVGAAVIHGFVEYQMGYPLYRISRIDTLWE